MALAGTPVAGTGVSNGKFVDGTDTNDAVYTGGNVGIGTTSPQERLNVEGKIRDDGQSVTSGTTLNNLSTVEFTVRLASGTTGATIATLSNFDTYTMAVASMEYTSIYSWAGSGLGNGKIMASTRRSNSNTSWTNNNNDVVDQYNSQTTTPTLFWDNGVLKYTQAASNEGIARVSITFRNADLN